ncbi:MAG: hypothetical protein JO086_03085 [Acidimicrobiia bacterium]|nr:hypothetical protein [Acidimicrobiia bacterium]
MTSHIDMVVGLDNVAEPTRSLHALDSVDYVDVSTLHTPLATSHSPEAWARAVLEGGDAVRRYAFIPWRLLLGLRLGPSHTPGYVHGWRVIGRGDDWIRAEGSSWLMTCNVVALVSEDAVTVALFVRYDHPLAPLWWGRMLSGAHRRLMPVILHQGEQVLASSGVLVGADR